MDVRITPALVTKIMLGIILTLTALHVTQLALYYYIGDPDRFDFIELVDFDYEANLPSLYSSLAILFCAALLGIIALHKKRTGAEFSKHWMGLAFIFVFLGVDEGVALHEAIGDAVETLELFDAKGWLYFAWVVPYGILFLLFSLSYLKFVLALPQRCMYLFIGSGTLFIFGAIGIETFSANEADINGTETVLYSVLYTIEELCEMIAIVIFSNALLHYIANDIGSLQIKVQPK